MAIPGIQHQKVYHRIKIPTVADPEAPTGWAMAKFIISTVERYYKLIPGTLSEKRRKSGNRIGKAKHMAMYFIRHNTDLTLMDIAAQFGNTHHTSVRYGVQMVETQISKPVCNTEWITEEMHLRQIIENR